jgi:hypothetical protein
MLFFGGVVWGRLIPSSDFWLIKIDGFFAVASSLATAVAAVAAWKAAQINKGQWDSSRKQTDIANEQSRLQFYMQHWFTFNEWLDEIERDNNVKFYKRASLYESIFPRNRNFSEPFSPVGDSEVFSWHSRFGKLVDRTCSPIGFEGRDAESWFSEYVMLAAYMHYSYLSPEDEQLVLGDTLPSGVSIENYEHVLVVMGNVLESLSKFSFCDGSPCSKGMSQVVKSGIGEFINSAQSNYSKNHRYRVWRRFG